MERVREEQFKIMRSVARHGGMHGDTHAIPALGRLRRERCSKLEASLVYIVSSSGSAAATWLLTSFSLFSL